MTEIEGYYSYRELPNDIRLAASDFVRQRLLHRARNGGHYLYYADQVDFLQDARLRPLLMPDDEASKYILGLNVSATQQDPIPPYLPNNVGNASFSEFQIALASLEAVDPILAAKVKSGEYRFSRAFKMADQKVRMLYYPGTIFLPIRRGWSVGGGGRIQEVTTVTSIHGHYFVVAPFDEADNRVYSHNFVWSRGAATTTLLTRESLLESWDNDPLNPKNER